MATHIVAWNYRAEVSAEERARLNRERDAAFAKLIGVIPGMTSVRFVYDMLPGSNRGFITISEHETEADIQAYAAHPEHNRLADLYVRPFVEDRVILNFV